MNWVAFWVVIVAAPMAICLMGFAPLILLRVVVWWDSRSVSFRQKARTAGEALGWVGAAVMLIAFATLVGYTWDDFR